MSRLNRTGKINKKGLFLASGTVIILILFLIAAMFARESLKKKLDLENSGEVLLASSYSVQRSDAAKLYLEKSFAQALAETIADNSLTVKCLGNSEPFQKGKCASDMTKLRKDFTGKFSERFKNYIAMFTEREDILTHFVKEKKEENGIMEELFIEKEDIKFRYNIENYNLEVSGNILKTTFNNGIKVISEKDNPGGKSYSVAYSAGQFSFEKDVNFLYEHSLWADSVAASSGFAQSITK